MYCFVLSFSCIFKKTVPTVHIWHLDSLSHYITCQISVKNQDNTIQYIVLYCIVLLHVLYCFAMYCIVLFMYCIVLNNTIDDTMYCL